MKQYEYVYLIGINRYKEYIKIGRTKSVAQRIKQMQTSLPFTLEIVYTIKTNNSAKLEAELHRKFAKCHVMSEWYLLTSQQILAVKLFYPENHVVLYT